MGQITLKVTLRSVVLNVKTVLRANLWMLSVARFCPIRIPVNAAIEPKTSDQVDNVCVEKAAVAAQLNNGLSAHYTSAGCQDRGKISVRS